MNSNTKQLDYRKPIKVGHYATFLIGLCTLFLFYKYLLQISPSVMTSELMASFQLEGAGLGNLAATFFYSYFIMQIFAGPMLDRFNIRYLASGAIAISAIGTILFANAHALWFAEIGRSLMGVGAAFATVTYLKVTADYFPPERFAFISGLLPTGVMIGAAIGGGPLAKLVELTGWRDSLLACALIGFLISSFFFIFMRNASPAMSQTAKVKATTLKLKDYLSVLTQPSNWFLTLYSGFAFAPLAVFSGLWGQPFLQTAYQLSSTHAASLATLGFIGFGFGGPAFGYLADRTTRPEFCMVLGGLISLISLIGIIYITPPMLLLSAFIFIFGFGVGAFMLGFAFAKNLNSLFLVGTVTAMINTGDALCGALSEPFIGHLLDLGWDGHKLHDAPVFSTQDYKHAFLILPAYIVLSLIFLWLAQRLQKNKK
ncbi:MFS transporter [Piscirickettsia litoralis]|uniref:Lysosomal dipeptide transporter MFSD1 n=1 Tax=Piscirickettsia litoralis TaxID=1891921 RepID=A0ABX3ACW2_9GAMM|nr:MFS transporter [Piscirickettsia litoralis]ODN44024.1 MFS transporter [Piscirickettsia litoralis]